MDYLSSDEQKALIEQLQLDLEESEETIAGQFKTMEEYEEKISKLEAEIEGWEALKDDYERLKGICDDFEGEFRSGKF